MSRKATVREKILNGLKDGGNPMRRLAVGKKARVKGIRSVVQELVREGVLRREERALYSAA